MREESQRSKQAKMIEDLEKAKHQVEECKKQLNDKKRQVDVWKNKVDKSCIERIRAFQNPPALIGQIMEMITYMIGRKKLSENSFIQQRSEQSTSGKVEKDDKSISEVSSKPSKPSKILYVES